MNMSGVDPVSPPGEPAPELLDGRIWLDGCWDFFHHGLAASSLPTFCRATNFLSRSCRRHDAGPPAWRRAVCGRALGRVHLGEQGSDCHELAGTVRLRAALVTTGFAPLTPAHTCSLAAVDACRWVTRSVPRAPYVTQLDWISHYGCRYVVHGDDITSDSSGEDCYRFVKQAGRFKVVKRTPSISTTDLVGRMLLCTRTHFIKSLRRTLSGEEGPGGEADRKAEGSVMTERMRSYATDESAKAPGASVWFWEASGRDAKTGHDGIEEKGTFVELFAGLHPKSGQRVLYVDGGFDLFSSGHIEFLRLVVEEENKLAAERGWDKDYSPVYVVAGVHDDEVINHWKGVNYPIMNIYERGLCVLQCKVRLAPTVETALATKF